MKAIWKYIIEPRTTIEMPIGAQILHVAEQRGQICLWVHVTPSNSKIARRFAVYGTGHDMPDDAGAYLGSAILMDGALVFHVFEETAS